MSAMRTVKYRIKRTVKYRCKCGGMMVPSLRYEHPTLAPTEVHCCFTCGFETEPLDCCEQAGNGERLGTTTCAHCGAAFGLRMDDGRPRRYCTDACRADYWHHRDVPRRVS